jgi:hypothetical protein
MPPGLTADQISFLNTYLRKGRVPQILGQHELLQELAQVKVPIGATPTEADQIRRRIAASRSLLDDSSTDRELMQAKRDLDEAVALVNRIPQRIADSRNRAVELAKTAREVAGTVDPDASATDRQGVAEAVQALTDLFGADPTPDEIVQAEGALSQLREQLRHLAEAGDLVRKQRAERAQALRQQAEELAKTIDADATESDRQGVARAVQELSDLFGADPTPDEIVQAEGALTQLRQRLQHLAEAGDLVRAQRAERAQALRQQAAELAKTIDADATKGDRLEVAKAASVVTDGLKDPVSADMLSKAEADIGLLKELLETIAKRCEDDRTRRREACKEVKLRVAGTPDPEAAEDEKQKLAGLAKPVLGLAEIPTDGQLETAAGHAETYRQELATLKDAVAERRERFKGAATLLVRLRPAAVALKPHDKAPAGESGPVTQEAAQLLLDSADLQDWAKVTTWTKDKLVELDKAIVLLEERMAAVNKATQQRIDAVDNAATGTKAVIEKAPGRAFTVSQQTPLLDLVKAETERFAKDVALSDSVIEALKKLATTVSALSVALAGADKRLAAVVPPADTDLSPKEKAALTKARDAATKGLDEVTDS